MNARPVYIGIDFGTSNSSIAYVIADPRDVSAKKIDVKTVRVQMNDDGNATTDRIPTVVSYDLNDRRTKDPLLGWDFLRKFWQPRRKSPLLRHGQTFFRSIKSDLGAARVYPYAFRPDFSTPEQVAAAIIRRLLDEARKKLQGYDLKSSHVVVTVPASLAAAAREQTREAAQMAGIAADHIELIDEPVAALLDFVNDGGASGLLEEERAKNLLVFDYGGGTLDLSLVRARFDSKSESGLKVENLAISQYRRLGGDDIDRAVMDEVVWPQIEKTGITRAELSKDDIQKIEDTLIPTVARLLKERVCRRIQAHLEGGNQRSEPETAPLPRTFEIPKVNKKLPKQFALSVEAFKSIMKPFMKAPGDDATSESIAKRFMKTPGEHARHWALLYPKSLLVPILEVLERGNVQPANLDALILHGSSCRNPLIRPLLKQVFDEKQMLFGGASILETPELDASVARGAALACYWRHARNIEIVPPIIAEEIGILTLNEQPVKLLDSGHPLPFPDESGVYEIPTTLYAPDTGICEMLVPVYTGRRQKLAGG